MEGFGKKSGLSKAATAVVIVIVLAAAGIGTIFATTKTITQTVTQTVNQTVTQTATVTSTVTSLQTPTANNTIDLTANETVLLVVTGLPHHPFGGSYEFSTGAGGFEFSIGGLINPTVKVKVGTAMKVLFYGPGHSFLITNAKPPYPDGYTNLLSQADLTPAFPGAGTDNPNHSFESHQTLTGGSVPYAILSFTADKPGAYYYICAVEDEHGLHASHGMFGQFIVEA